MLNYIKYTRFVHSYHNNTAKHNRSKYKRLEHTYSKYEPYVTYQSNKSIFKI